MRYTCVYYGCPFELPVPDLPPCANTQALLRAAMDRYSALEATLLAHAIVHAPKGPPGGSWGFVFPLG